MLSLHVCRCLFLSFSHVVLYLCYSGCSSPLSLLSVTCESVSRILHFLALRISPSLSPFRRVALAFSVCVVIDPSQVKSLCFLQRRTADGPFEGGTRTPLPAVICRFAFRLMSWPTLFHERLFLSCASGSAPLVRFLVLRQSLRLDDMLWKQRCAEARSQHRSRPLESILLCLPLSRKLRPFIWSSPNTEPTFPMSRKQKTCKHTLCETSSPRFTSQGGSCFHFCSLLALLVCSGAVSLVSGTHFWFGGRAGGQNVQKIDVKKALGDFIP